MRYNSKLKPTTAHTCRSTTKSINCNCLQVLKRPKLANIMHQKISRYQKVSRYFLMFPNIAIYCFRDISRYKTLSPGPGAGHHDYLMMIYDDSKMLLWWSYDGVRVSRVSRCWSSSWWLYDDLTTVRRGYYYDLMIIAWWSHDDGFMKW